MSEHLIVCTKYGTMELIRDEFESCDWMVDIIKRCAEMQKQNNLMRECLELYAQKNTEYMDDWETIDCEEVLGKMARECLKQLGEMESE